MTARRDQLKAHTFRRRRTALVLVSGHRALDDELPAQARPWIVGLAIVVLLVAGLAVAALLDSDATQDRASSRSAAVTAGFHRPEADR